MKQLKLICSTLILAGVVSLFSGCASVDLADTEADAEAKTFAVPFDGTGNVYIYRNSPFGTALNTELWIDGQYIGESAPNVFFKKNLPAGEHVISTESEFGKNHILLNLIENTNKFIRQYIKMGVFIGGSNVEEITEEQDKRDIQKLKLAQPKSDPSKDMHLSIDELKALAQW